MTFAAKPKKVADQPEEDLASKIGRFQVELDAFIDEKTRALKETADGRSQPFAALRQMLTRNNSCLCAAALILLENEKSNVARANSI